MASRAGLSSVKRSGKAGGNHPFLRHGVDVAGQDGDPFSEITLRFAINRPNRFGDGFAASGGFEGAFGARYTRVNWESFGYGAIREAALRGHKRIATGSVPSSAQCARQLTCIQSRMTVGIPPKGRCVALIMRTFSAALTSVR